MTDDDIHRILSYLQARRPDMVDLLQRLALAESPSDKPDAVAPVLAILTSELELCGMSVRLFKGRVSAGTLFARPRERNEHAPIQLLVGHCDTVWPVGTVRQMPVRVEGETLRGPGVFDMKAGLTQMLYALRAVKDLGLRSPADSVVVINSDEEIGSPDSTRLIRRLARQAARAYVLEPAFGRAGKLKTARKASGGFTITIKGRAAHAGVNLEEGVSAILEMSHQIQRLFALNDAARGITVNVGTIDGGLRSNVIAAEVRASVDVRVRTRRDAAEVEAAIRGLQPVNPETTIEVEGGIEQQPMEPLPRNQALWRLARDLGRRIGLELDQASVGGASDGNTTSQYTATLDGLGAVGDGAHAAHEQTQIPQMVERCALLVLLLMSPLTDETGETQSVGVMMNQPRIAYRHTQMGPWSLLLFAIGALMVAIAWSSPEQQPVRMILSVAGAVMLALAPCFHQLTVADEGDRLAIQFGFVPLFQKRIRYSDIQAFDIGTTSFLDGWGIHLSWKGGWVWNIWGWRCVVIRHGGTTRVGTNDAEDLAAFLRTKIPAAASGSEGQP